MAVESELERAKRLLAMNQKSEIAKVLLELLPQGHGSGLDADTVDGLHAVEIIAKAPGRSGGGSGGGAPSPHATSHHKGESDALGCVVVLKFGAEGSTTTSTLYVVIADSDIAFDPSLFRFEGTLYMKIIAHIKNDTAGETTYLQVYRQNAGTVVAGSEVSVVGAGWGIVASGWIDWSAEVGNESYQLRMMVTGGVGEYNSVLMILSPVQL